MKRCGVGFRYTPLIPHFVFILSSPEVNTNLFTFVHTHLLFEWEQNGEPAEQTIRVSVGVDAEGDFFVQHGVEVT